MIYKTIFDVGLLALLVGQSVRAAEWEYQVIFLPGTVNGGDVVKQPNGVYLDKDKTETLNALAADGWEVIAVTGDSGADHAIYMRRNTGN